MSFLDALRAVRQSKQVAKHSFLSTLSTDRKSIHLFIEGKTDISFYETIVLRETNQYRINTHVCGNKDEVYATKDEVHANDDDNNILMFFVDKDLDDIIPIRRENCELTHITDTYSIENYFLSTEVFRRYYCDVFKMPHQSPEIDTIIEKLSIANTSSYTTFKKIMSWVLSVRRCGILIDLSNIKMSDIFYFNQDLEISTKMSDAELIQYLHDKTGVMNNIPEYNITTSVEDLEKIEHKSYIRGKFHAWVFIKFTEQARIFLETAIAQRIKQTTTLTESNIVELFSSRIPTPPSIKEFIDRRLSKS